MLIVIFGTAIRKIHIDTHFSINVNYINLYTIQRVIIYSSIFLFNIYKIICLNDYLSVIFKFRVKD